MAKKLGSDLRFLDSPHLCSTIPVFNLLAHNLRPRKSEFKYSQKANFYKYLLGKRCTCSLVTILIPHDHDGNLLILMSNLHPTNIPTYISGDYKSHLPPKWDKIKKAFVRRLKAWLSGSRNSNLNYFKNAYKPDAKRNTVMAQQYGSRVISLNSLLVSINNNYAVKEVSAITTPLWRLGFDLLILQK